MHNVLENVTKLTSLLKLNLQTIPFHLEWNMCVFKNIKSISISELFKRVSVAALLIHPNNPLIYLFLVYFLLGKFKLRENYIAVCFSLYVWRKNWIKSENKWIETRVKWFDIDVLVSRGNKYEIRMWVSCQYFVTVWKWLSVSKTFKHTLRLIHQKKKMKRE